MKLPICIPALLALGITASAASAATFLVEQYDVYLGTRLDAYETYAAANTPDYVTRVNYIDFSDDVARFNGHRAGAMPWPGAVETGQFGRNAAVNQTFFARITARLSVAVADTYTFRTSNDDGVFVRVGDELVINDGSLHGERVFFGSKYLGVGTHDIELYFFENGGAASLEFSFQSTSSPYIWTGSNEAAFVAPVPQPATALLMLGAMSGLRFAARKRKT